MVFSSHKDKAALIAQPGYNGHRWEHHGKLADLIGGVQSL
jgi:hypothetical protein